MSEMEFLQLYHTFSFTLSYTLREIKNDPQVLSSLSLLCHSPVNSFSLPLKKTFTSLIHK